MNRNAVRMIGIFLLVVFGFMAATPYLAAHTDFYSSSGNYNIQIGTLKLMSVTHDVNGLAIGTASFVTAILALVGVGLIVGVFTFAPIRKSRHVITHR